MKDINDYYVVDSNTELMTDIRFTNTSKAETWLREKLGDNYETDRKEYYILAEGEKMKTKNGDLISYSKYSPGNLIDVEIEGVDFRDYPDFVDAYVTSATFKDTGIDLTETELDELNESDNRYDLVYNWLF